MFSRTPSIIRFHKRLRVVQAPDWPKIEPVIVALVCAFIVGSWAGYALASRDQCQSELRGAP